MLFSKCKVFGVDSKIQKVKTMHDYTIAEFELENGETIKNVDKMTVYGFCAKRINPVTFRMLNDACLGKGHNQLLFLFV